MAKCDNPRCRVCYPNWEQEEAAVRKAEEDRRQETERWWRTLQQEAEAIATIGSPIARNARINAEYAKLWLGDQRFQWAGLAAFASKQVGCGLLNAAEMIRTANRQRDMYQEWDKIASLMERASPYSSPRVSAVDQSVGASSHKAFTMLAKGSAAIFLELWPLHRFFIRWGFERFNESLGERQKVLRDIAQWPGGHVHLFATPHQRIRDAFAAIHGNDIHTGVKLLLDHEQLHILQPVLYDDPAFAALVRANQLAWVLNMPSGSIQELQLTLASQCSVTGGDIRKVPFSSDPQANLADPVQRMKFVRAAADRFDYLLKTQPHDVENSLFLIAQGGGR